MVLTRQTSLRRRLKKRWLDSVALWRTLEAFRYDLRRYVAHSSTRGPYATRENLAAKITERYHSIEKGLALPEPRPGFGKGVVPTLVGLVETYIRDHGEDHITQAAVGALAAYRDFNLQAGLTDADLPGHPELQRMVMTRARYDAGTSGVKRLRRADVEAAVAAVSPEFFTSRHSTRIFDPAPVAPHEIELAVQAATTAPAVCNREFSSVTIWTAPDRVREVLALQGGAKGFEHQVPALAMVTVTLRSYWSEAERNQGWIDGGLFAMSFLLGLHAQGLGAVALNWSKSPHTDRQMRALVGLPQDRSIVMFVAFGHLLDEYRVAASPRRPPSGFFSVDPS